jgi:hypothetical protein
VSLSDRAKSQRVGGAIPGRAVQPRRQDRPVAQRGGLAPKDEEDRLRNVIRQVRIAHLPQRRGVDHVQVTGDELVERVALAPEVGAKQVQVGRCSRDAGHFNHGCNVDRADGQIFLSCP